MDPTTISVFAVGATLLAVGSSSAALILTDQRSLRTEIAAVETRLGKPIDDTKSELGAVEARLGKRMDRLEDRLDGLAALRGVPPQTPTPDESPA